MDLDPEAKINHITVRNLDEEETLGGQSLWNPFWREYTEGEKTLIVSKVIMVAVETVFKNHIYTFQNRLYKQEKGGAIGARLTGEVAHIVMDVWAELLLEILKRNRVETHLLAKSN